MNSMSLITRINSRKSYNTNTPQTIIFLSRFLIFHHPPREMKLERIRDRFEDNPSIVNYNQNREFPFFRVVGNQRDHGMDSRNAETEDWPDRVERKGGERRFRFQGGLKVENPSCL